MLFKRPPDLPQESKLPAVANALGPMERLQRDYPHLARLKHEMIVNIMHFAVTYCLDWVIELITMRVRRGGGIIYKFPPLGENGEVAIIYGFSSNPEYSAPSQLGETTLEVLYEENGAEIAPYRWQPPRAHDMQMPSSSDRQREAPPRRPDVPSTVDLPDVANQSRKDDEWEEMLRTSQNDPDLPKHYKTMIRCLVERSGTEVVKSTVLSELLDELHGTEADHVVTAAIVSCQEELRRDDLHKRIGGIFPQRFSNPHKFKRRGIASRKHVQKFLEQIAGVFPSGFLGANNTRMLLDTILNSILLWKPTESWKISLPRFRTLECDSCRALRSKTTNLSRSVSVVQRELLFRIATFLTKFVLKNLL
ncbi:unnamed protein product [Heligmosomoides polygyrus]|uniref:MIF4G domain-containing protein n=1 Tax=Heligmosomoides polygyrus TaxID=6339 RepID=A0A183G3L5_HELPZ|nr:unnamed protein product [Heligmosomoides polygyrus]